MAALAWMMEYAIAQQDIPENVVKPRIVDHNVSTEGSVLMQMCVTAKMDIPELDAKKVFISIMHHLVGLIHDGWYKILIE